MSVRGDTPAVSVLVPNLNGARWLEGCLRSVLDQTAGDLEVIVGDEASSDGSREVVESIRDARVQLVTRPIRLGQAANTNDLRGRARGQYIAVLNSDDWWEPGFLERMRALLDATPTALFATCAANIVEGGLIREQRGMHLVWPGPAGACPSNAALSLLLGGNRMHTPSVLATRRMYELVPRYEEALLYVQDWWMWLRVAALGDLAVSPEPLANYRVHDQSLTATARATTYGADLVRLMALARAEWGASDRRLRALGATVTSELVELSYHLAQLGDLDGARTHSRLARATAPAWPLRRVAQASELLWTVARVPGLGGRAVEAVGPVKAGMRRSLERLRIL